MRCPCCSTTVRLDIRETSVYSIRNTESSEKRGVEVGHGFCPECNQLIVYVKHGEYRFIEDKGELITTNNEEVVYPRIYKRCTASEVPLIYMDMFNEANSVLPISPKASAALSRRLLQLILRDEYKVNRGDLWKEIKEFLSQGDIPSQLKEEVDAIRIIGNFAAHPNKDQVSGEIIDVEPGEAEWLLDILENIFKHKFIEPQRELDRKNRLNNKLQALGKSLMS